MGSAVCEFISETHPVPIRMLGIKDRFGESGTPLELLKHFNLTTGDVIKAVHEVLKAKKQR
ncbi:MAG: transketolase family protein, partial [Candidatus Omnitrophota bacterium]